MNIEITGLTKNYDTQVVLKEMDLALGNVGTIGIIGESGCGKSTLLRILAGIEPPSKGEILINGLSPIHEKKHFQKKIGVVFQKHNLFPHLTLRENIALILRKVKKIDKQTADDKAFQMLQKLFIEKEADKKPSQVSGGQAQRASLARALVTEPELIFLDEPTAALDPLLTYEVLKAIQSLKQEGIEFIFVTHEMSFLKEFADYIIFLKEGRICEQGHVSCLESPRTKELKAFLSIGGVIK